MAAYTAARTTGSSITYRKPATAFAAGTGRESLHRGGWIVHVEDLLEAVRADGGEGVHGEQSFLGCTVIDIRPSQRLDLLVAGDGERQTLVCGRHAARFPCPNSTYFLANGHAAMIDRRARRVVPR